MFVPIENESFFNGMIKVFHKKTVGALIAASGLLLFTLFPFQQDNEVYAYMSIDGEPSIELAVNKDLEVIELVAYNESGEDIISNINNWKNKEVSEVSAKIFTSIAEDEAKEVVVGTVYAGDRVETTDEKLQKVMSKIEQKFETKLENVEATAVERNEAKEKGMSVGEYVSKQAKEKAEDKKKEDNSKKETVVEIPPAPSVVVPDQNSTNTTPSENSNSNKQNENQQTENVNNNGNQNNNGQQKQEDKKEQQQNNVQAKKNDLKPKEMNGMKVEKPSK